MWQRAAMEASAEDAVGQQGLVRDHGCLVAEADDDDMNVD